MHPVTTARMASKQSAQPSQVKPGTTLYTYPLKDRKIEVKTNDANELIARVDGSKEKKTLLLGNLPDEIKKTRDESKLKRFFERVHLVLEGDEVKGEEVKVNVYDSRSDRGDVRNMIPFHPSLTLGGIVRRRTIEEMQAQARNPKRNPRALRAELKASQDNLREKNSEVKVQSDRVDQLVKAKASEDEIINEDQIALSLQAEARLECLNQQRILSELYKSHTDISSELPSVFQHGLNTVIDLSLDESIKSQPRGSKEAYFVCDFIDLRTTDKEVVSSIKGSKAIGNISASGSLYSCNIGGAARLDSSIGDRIVEMKETGGVEAVLIINAFVSTGYVKCIPTPSYKEDELKMIYQMMKTGSEKEHDDYGITTLDKNGEKAIYLITEEVMGGAFSALVTFSNSKIAAHNTAKHLENRNISAGVNGGVSIGPVKADFDISGQHGKEARSDEDKFRHSLSTKVNIEILSKGAIPTFSIEALQQKINYLDEGQGILSANSVFNAFQEFVKELRTNPLAGAPLGFNYTVLTQSAIEQKLKDLNVDTKKIGASSEAEHEGKAGHAAAPAGLQPLKNESVVDDLFQDSGQNMPSQSSESLVRSVGNPTVEGPADSQPGQAQAPGLWDVARSKVKGLMGQPASPNSRQTGVVPKEKEEDQ